MEERETNDRELEAETKKEKSSAKRILLVIAGCGGLFVLGIVALGAFIVPQIMDELLESQVAVTRADLEVLDTAVSNFAIENSGRFPDSLEDLIRPDEQGQRFLDSETVPVDPWGSEYRYDPPQGETPHRVWSLGADGEPGGEGPAADLFAN